MSSMMLLNIAMLIVIVFLAIAINRTGKTNKLLHDMNQRERMRDHELSSGHEEGEVVS